MDPNIPWRALAAQMKLAPWRAPPEGQPSPTKAAAQQMSAAWNLGPAGSMLIEHSHNTQGTADAHAKVFVAAGTGHGLVHVWQAVGWGACLWQRVAVKGQVADAPIAGLAFTADGCMLAATGGSLGGIWTWDSSTWEGSWQPGGPTFIFQFLGSDWPQALTHPRLLVCPRGPSFAPTILPVRCPPKGRGINGLSQPLSAGASKTEDLVPLLDGPRNSLGLQDLMQTYLPQRLPPASSWQPPVAAADPTQEAAHSESVEAAEFDGATALAAPQAAPQAADVRRQAAATAVDVPRHVQQYSALQDVCQNTPSEAGPQVMRRKVGKQLAPQWVASRAAKPQLSDLWRAKEQVTSALDTRPLPVPSTITQRNVAQQIARQILRGSR
ncbi:hypothetical protein WJX84_002769 [Apatococcus fuscideae]|uniref:Uncharacterized protein n=1 Tax=Apatococcus fuscideae TaxID=2026836 RepID=A0AAW1SUI0_9CHLO